MRFCPFCAQDNPDDARECVHCGKRLPALRQPKLTPSKAPAPSSPPPRPAPPRPMPRTPSLAPPLTSATAPPTAPHDVASSGAVTLTPPTRPQPSNGPTARPGDRTLRPEREVDEDNEETMTREVPSPPHSAPTGTLLGLPAQELGASTKIALESERDSGKRTTKPLGIATIRGEARKGSVFDEDAATTVDDSPTAPNPKAEEDLEQAITRARPAPRSRPLDSPPASPPVPPPPRRPTPSYGVATKPVPSSSTAPTRPTSMPAPPGARKQPIMTPEPLPPPPPPGRVGNEAGSFPQLDIAPTPAIPTLALPPMPQTPSSGSIVDSVKYLPPLARAIWARKKAQDAIRTLLHGDQRALDAVLRDLGQAARAAEVNAPAVADEMRLIREQEERRATAEQAVADGEGALKKEEDRWHIDQGERLSELARREADVKICDEDLRKKAEERRGHEAERARLDGQIRALEKKAAAADARAAKADVTPPEKGGGPNTAANARAEAAELRKQATELIPNRDKAKAEVEKLDGPIATLTQQLTDGRAAIVQKRKDLADAKTAHHKALADLQAARERAAAERDAAERELTQRFVTAGTILNLNRVEHPKLTSLFGRIDELKNGVNAREAAIVRLESERRMYDRATVQKGLLTVGIAAGAVILLAIVLIVLIAR